MFCRHVPDGPDCLISATTWEVPAGRSATIAAHGLVKRLQRTTLIWQVMLYERPVA
jgi:hypothetical protein